MENLDIKDLPVVTIPASGDVVTGVKSNGDGQNINAGAFAQASQLSGFATKDDQEDTGWIDIPINSPATGELQVIRRNRTVFISAFLRNIPTFAAGFVICTLADKYRPMVLNIAALQFSSNNAGTYVEPNGSVVFNGATAGVGGIEGAWSYPV